MARYDPFSVLTLFAPLYQPLNVVDRSRSALIFLIGCSLHRSWVCGGQPAVCGWGGASELHPGEQIPVGAAAAQPEAVHGKSDMSALLCRSSAAPEWIPAPCTRGDGAYRRRAANVLSKPDERAHAAHVRLFQARCRVSSAIQSKGSQFSEGLIQNLDYFLSDISGAWLQRPLPPAVWASEFVKYYSPNPLSGRSRLLLLFFSVIMFSLSFLFSLTWAVLVYRCLYERMLEVSFKQIVIIFRRINDKNKDELFNDKHIYTLQVHMNIDLNS